MMQAGKDYITKDDSEYESPRVRSLRELLKSIKAQAEYVPDEVDQAKFAAGPTKVEAEPVKPTNQTKPTLKLK